MYSSGTHRDDFWDHTTAQGIWTYIICTPLRGIPLMGRSNWILVFDVDLYESYVSRNTGLIERYLTTETSQYWGHNLGSQGWLRTHSVLYPSLYSLGRKENYNGCYYSSINSLELQVYYSSINRLEWQVCSPLVPETFLTRYCDLNCSMSALFRMINRIFF